MVILGSELKLNLQQLNLQGRLKFQIPKLNHRDERAGDA
jgi:hypothetical protein